MESLEAEAVWSQQEAWQVLMESVTDMLGAIQKALRGEPLDDMYYARVFGTKEGVLPQLQKVTALLKELQAMQTERSGGVQQIGRWGEAERAMARCCLSQMKTLASADAEVSAQVRSPDPHSRR